MAKKEGKKTRKYKRNRAKCEKYRAMGRREFNKARKAARRLKRMRRISTLVLV